MKASSSKLVRTGLPWCQKKPSRAPALCTLGRQHQPCNISLPPPSPPNTKRLCCLSPNTPQGDYGITFYSLIFKASPASLLFFLLSSLVKLSVSSFDLVTLVSSPNPQSLSIATSTSSLSCLGTKLNCLPAFWIRWQHPLLLHYSFQVSGGAISTGLW